jgi:hypothetical protein
VGEVVVAPGAGALGEMLAELVRGNIASDPSRAQLVEGVAGRVNIRANDAKMDAGLLFTGRELRVGEALRGPDLEIVCDSATLMDLANVKLRFGRPDPLTPKGRELIGKIARRNLVVKGMLAHPRLLTRVQKLMSVA